MAERNQSAGGGWIQHALRRAPWRKQSQTAAIAALALIVAIIIGALYLAQAMNIATAGRQLEQLQAQRNRLQVQNDQLIAEIAQFRSVPRLTDRARELGFVSAQGEQIQYLPVDGYLPYEPETVAPLTEDEPESAVPIYDETFGGWLQQQWDALIQQFEAWTSTPPPDETGE